MQTIRGAFESSAGESFVGHRVQVEFEEPISVAGMVDPSVRTGVRTAPVAPDGTFELSVPDLDHAHARYSLSIVAPDGTILRRGPVDDLCQPVRLRLEPAPAPELAVHPDALKGRRARLTGRLLDSNGGRAHRGVRILARRTTASPLEVVFDARSASRGYFTGEYPRGPFTEAILQIEGAKEAMPLALTAGALPRHLPLVVDLPPDEEIDACSCDDQPPRVPDPEDLAIAGDAFSQDLGTGCVGLSKANRVLEEYDYFRVVRTTEPELYRPSSEDRELFARALVRRAVPTLRLAAAPNDDDSSDARGVLALSRSAANDVAFGRLRRALGSVLHPDGRAQLDSSNPVDWDGPADLRQAATIAHGHLLHFRQVWRADGYSLGDLIYSLPLAPNQQKQIAIVDWERRQSARRTEAVDEAEQLTAALARDRDINEIVSTTLGESLFGSSAAETEASSGGFSLPGLLTQAWSSGSASSMARQESARDLTAASIQELHDRITQAASAVRSQRSTVVQSVAEGETARAQTEVVGNYNHCHALTVEYFEVLRHFLVTHELVEARECLLVPLLMELFDAEKARRWRDPLARLLRDRALVGGFTALDRLARSTRTSAHADEDIESIQGQLRMRVRIARPRGPRGSETFDEWNSVVWSVFARFSPASARAIYDRLSSADGLVDEVWQEQYAPTMARNYVAGLRFVAVDRAGVEHPLGLTASLLRYIPGRTHTIRINAGARPGLPRREIAAIIVRSTYELPAGSLGAISSVQLDYQTATETLALLDRGGLLDDLAIGDDVYLATPPDAADLADPLARDERLAARLLEHLNDHLEYYHRLIWQRMDPARRYLLLDGFRAPDGSGRSLASVVENRVIGIVGNSLVFPVVPGVHLDPTYRPSPGTGLIDLYGARDPDPGFRVTVPTRGVFAESVMGDCNACEVKDDSRFWRYEEAAPPAFATPIQPVSTASRRGDTPDLRASPLPNPIVNIQNAPAAPDPAGLAAALRVVSTPDVFRDVTGLTENQRNALGALQETAREAQAILASNNKFAIDALRTFFGGGASTGGADQQARQATATRNLDRTMAAIKGAMRDGLISRDEARNLATMSLRQATGADAMTRRATDDPAIKSLLSSAAARPQSAVTVVRPDETLSISQGGDPYGDFVPAAFDDEAGSDIEIANREFAQSSGAGAGTGANTAITQDLFDWLRSAANDVAFFRGSDVTSYFMATTGETFMAWFANNVGGTGAWAARTTSTSAVVHARFEQIFDRIPVMFDEDAASLLQFACLVSLMINEVGGQLRPDPERGGAAYFFNAVGKQSYNRAPNRTAFDNFNDDAFIDAHRNRGGAAQLARTTDTRWAGRQYPANIPQAWEPFIRESDFYKFRGRGLIQTTWRDNYLEVIRFVQSYTGQNAKILQWKDNWAPNNQPRDPQDVATSSTNADWDDLFLRSDLEMPCQAVGIHQRRRNRYLRLAHEADPRDPSGLRGALESLNGVSPGSIWYAGYRINGRRYADLFRRRVIQLLETLMLTPAPSSTPSTTPMPFPGP